MPIRRSAGTLYRRNALQYLGKRSHPYIVLHPGSIRSPRPHPGVKRLEKLLREALGRVATLEREVEALRAGQSDDVIVLREISKEEARQEIIGLFRAGKPLDQADLADALSLELTLVMEVCNELIAEGVVVFYDDNGS